MARLHFVIDPQKELEYHKFFKSVKGLEVCSNFENIKDESAVLKTIQDFWTEELRDHVKKMQATWDEINDEYFRLLQEITDSPLLYDDYYCYLCSNTTLGFSNPFDARSKEFILIPVNLSIANYLAAHELFHTHYYSIWSKLGLSEVSPTLLTEGTAVLGMLFSNMQILFNNDMNFIDSCIKSYPIVEDNWAELAKSWKARESFNSFLTTTYKVLCE